MTMNKFDQIIASKLNSANYTADKSVWANIERELPRSAVSGSNINAAFFGGILTTAILVLGFSLLPTYDGVIESPFDTIEPTALVTSDALTHFEAVDVSIITPLDHKPQERHEIELVSLELVSPIQQSENKLNSAQEPEKTNVKAASIAISNSDQTTKNQRALTEQIDFKAAGIQCIDNTVHFNPSSNALSNVRWIFDGIHVVEGSLCEFTFIDAGEHEVVMIFDQENETYSVKKSIQIFEAPTPIISYSIISSESCFEQSIKLSCEPSANKYNWSLNEESGQGSNIILKATEGAHSIKLTAISAEGCVANLSQEVFVDGGLKIFIPNSFTPDNDGHNDAWFANGLEKCSAFTVQVYRANDQALVYETNELTPWNGSVNGSAEKAQRGDKFIYRILATDDCNYSKEISGTITTL